MENAHIFVKMHKTKFSDIGLASSKGLFFERPKKGTRGTTKWTLFHQSRDKMTVRGQCGAEEPDRGAAMANCGTTAEVCQSTNMIMNMIMNMNIMKLFLNSIFC